MKYKVGDKVRIKTHEEMKKGYNFPSLSYDTLMVGYYGFTIDMEEWINKNFLDRILTIRYVERNYYDIKHDLNHWRWNDRMIECLAKYYFENIITDRFEILDL